MATPTQLQLDIVFAGFVRQPRKAGRYDARLAAIASAIRQAWVAWKRRGLAAETYHALAGLDARTLRDLGFDHSELGSVAAELAGEAERTRVYARRRFARQ